MASAGHVGRGDERQQGSLACDAGLVGGFADVGVEVDRPYPLLRRHPLTRPRGGPPPLRRGTPRAGGAASGRGSRRRSGRSCSTGRRRPRRPLPRRAPGGAPRRSSSTASGSAYCSPARPATKRPPRATPRASMRRSAHTTSRQGTLKDSRPHSSHATTPQRVRSWWATASASSSLPGTRVLDPSAAESGVAGPRTSGPGRSDHRPSPIPVPIGGAPATQPVRGAAHGPCAPAVARREERADGGERVGRHQAARDQVPEALVHLGREPPRHRSQLGTEASTAGPESGQHVCRRRRPRAPAPQYRRARHATSSRGPRAPRRRAAWPARARRCGPAGRPAASTGPTPPHPTGRARPTTARRSPRRAPGGSVPPTPPRAPRSPAAARAPGEGRSGPGAGCRASRAASAPGTERSRRWGRPRPDHGGAPCWRGGAERGGCGRTSGRRAARSPNPGARAGPARYAPAPRRGERRAVHQPEGERPRRAGRP